MLKLFLAKLKKTNNISNDVWHRLGASLQSQDENNIYSEIFAQRDNWLRGNIFLGPQNRGSFDPTFSRDESEYFEAFEADAETIIGQDRFNQLKRLYDDLQSFVSSAIRMNPVGRLLIGFELFVRISNLLITGIITPMNDRQWEFRVPTEQELRNTVPENMRRFLRTQRYWAIKKPSDRFPRSTNHLSENPSETATQKDLSYQWNKFFTDLLSISMEANARKESVTWLCNFTRLHYDYLFNATIPDNQDCAACLSFGTYLYSKISISND